MRASRSRSGMAQRIGQPKHGGSRVVETVLAGFPTWRRLQLLMEREALATYGEGKAPQIKHASADGLNDIPYSAEHNCRF